MNRTREILDERKKERLMMGIAMLFCFAVHIILIKQFANWYSTDVEGYLSHAATFSGRDWSGVLKNAGSFYSWGYSLLLTIPMLFTSNVTTVYYVAILFNALLCCGILLLCYAIAKRIAPGLNRYLLLLCATAVSVYSSYTFQGAVMLSEIFLYFFVLLNIFLLLRYLETDKAVWGILTGLSVGYTYIIHNRAIAVVIAYFMVAIAWSIKSRSWKKLFIMLAPLALMLLVNHGVVQYLNAQEKQGQNYSRNTFEYQTRKINNKINFYTIISVMECILGECWYAFIGSFGMIGIGAYSVIREIGKEWKKKSCYIFFYGFLILILIGTLGVSVLNNAPGAPLGETGRYDLYTYGRYWETVFGIFVLLGLIEACKRIKINVMVEVILGSAFLSVVTEYITRAYQNNAYNYWGIPAVLTTLFYPERKFTVIASSIVGIMLMVLIFYLFSQNKNSTIVVGIGIWTLFNIFTAYNSIYNVSSLYKEGASVYNMPFYNADFNEVCNYLEDSGTEEFAVCAEDGYRSIAFQLAYPDKKIVGITLEEDWDDSMKIYVVDKLNWSGEILDNLVYENESYYVFEQ